MSDKIKGKQEWVKMISRKELENRLKEAKALAATAKEKISFYEKEIERRKEVPLGVPAERKAYREAYFVNCAGDVIDQPLDANDSYDKKIFDMLDVFNSEASAEKHKEMLLDWRKALVANAKGEQIDIRVLLPLLQKGYVAMDENKRWYHYKHEPTKSNSVWTTTEEDGLLCLTNAFNIGPVENWTLSLMECGI